MSSSPRPLDQFSLACVKKGQGSSCFPHGRAITEGQEEIARCGRRGRRLDVQEKKKRARGKGVKAGFSKAFFCSTM